MFDERDVSFVYGEGMCYTQHTTVCDIHTAHYVWLCAVIFAALFASSNFHTYQVKMEVKPTLQFLHACKNWRWEMSEKEQIVVSGIIVYTVMLRS